MAGFEKPTALAAIGNRESANPVGGCKPRQRLIRLTLNVQREC